METSLRPSEASRWVSCTASPVLVSKSGVEFDHNEANMIGKIDHELCRIEFKRLNADIRSSLKKDYDAAPDLFNKVYDSRFEKQRIDSRRQYKEVLDSFSHRYVLKLEEYFEMNTELDLKKYGYRMRGYIDAVGFAEGKILIVEYKTGAMYVSDYNNIQMLLYAYSQYRKEVGIGRKINEIETVVVQPKAGEPRSQVYSAEALLLTIGKLKASVERIKNGDTSINPNDSNCMFCAARKTGTCPYFKSSFDTVNDFIGGL